MIYSFLAGRARGSHAPTSTWGMSPWRRFRGGFASLSRFFCARRPGTSVPSFCGIFGLYGALPSALSFLSLCRTEIVKRERVCAGMGCAFAVAISRRDHLASVCQALKKRGIDHQANFCHSSSDDVHKTTTISTSTTTGNRAVAGTARASSCLPKSTASLLGKNQWCRNGIADEHGSTANVVDAERYVPITLVVVPQRDQTPRDRLVGRNAVRTFTQEKRDC